jgi:hypothetical protein
VTSGVSASGDGTGSRSVERSGWSSGRLGSEGPAGTVEVRGKEVAACGGVDWAAKNSPGCINAAVTQKFFHRDDLANALFNPNIAPLSGLRRIKYLDALSDVPDH